MSSGCGVRSSQTKHLARGTVCRRAATDESHARIYAALAAGDAQQARSEMRDHIHAAYDSLLDETRAGNERCRH